MVGRVLIMAGYLQTNSGGSPRSFCKCRGFRSGAAVGKGLLILVVILLIPITAALGKQSQSSSSVSSLRAVSTGLRAQSAIAPLWGGAIEFTSDTASSAGRSIDLHHSNQPCQTCHNSSGGGSATGASGSSGSQMAVDINKSCTSSGCHDYNRVLNHPVGVRPVGSVPADMPLDGFSRITCLTCHEQNDPSGFADGTDSGERTLGVPTGSQSCTACHSTMGGDLKSRSHWQFSQKAHLGDINPQSGPGNSPQFVGNIDVESQTCVSCHEDVTVTVPGLNETRQQKINRRQGMKDHPIGMDYVKVVARSGSRFRHIAEGAGRIRLFQGRVGCGSCHSPYARDKSNLLKTKDEGDLCAECHIH